MPLAGQGGGGGLARMLAVYAGAELVYQLTGANLSSPQTAEMNAHARAPTIGKWVSMTNAKSVVWITGLCLLSESLWPAVGGGAAALDMFLSYRYAIRSGLESGAPPTERY